MKLSRINSYKGPDYPTRDYLHDHPELLRCIPKRWQNNKLVLSVLGMVVPIILTCTASNCQPKQTVKVAPIFIHGEGRGSFGCQVINPPVFLSEDEARQVIQDEAGKAGLEFKADGLTLNKVQVPETYMYEYWEKQARKNFKPKSKKIPLVMDGYDQKHRVAYEVVSMEDFNAWGKKYKIPWSTVWGFDFKDTATRLRNGLIRVSGDETIAIFYDPVVRRGRIDMHLMFSDEKEWKKKVEEKTAEAKIQCEKEFRAQVRDFISWLQAQGVI